MPPERVAVPAARRVDLGALRVPAAPLAEAPAAPLAGVPARAVREQAQAVQGQVALERVPREVHPALGVPALR